MKILVTGAKGFVGRNLVENLKNIRDGKRIVEGIVVDEIYECDIETEELVLDNYCQYADFVFHLAGVNRPKDNNEFITGNVDFAKILIQMLEKHNNLCPIMVSSSIQASLDGRFANSEYGLTKCESEKLFFSHERKTGAKVLVYRFPNLFGKWCRPNYNSVIATFCNNIANDLPIQVNDENAELELLYIDDLVNEMLNALKNQVHRCDYEGANLVKNEQGYFCYVPCVYRVTLKKIVELINGFKLQRESLIMPEMKNDSFEKKLYSTYLTYIPEHAIKYPLHMNKDERGSFTELLKTQGCGQISVNISKPGVIKGQHWHNSKWEFFVVVVGKALIQERKIGSDHIIEFEVSGEKLEVVQMIPGYTHNIINLSDTENLVTVMWANEQFDCENPDTFYEKC